MTKTDLYARVTDRIISDLEKGRPPMAETAAGRPHRRTNHASASPQWNALPGNQHPAFVGVGHRQGIQLQYMNDLQAGA